MFARATALSVVVLFATSAAAQAQVLQQPLVPGAAIEQKLDAQVPLDAVFRDEAGQTRRLGDYFGERPVVLILAYYRCPRLCSMVLNGAAEALQRTRYEMGSDFDVVTVSIDPRETAELAAAKKETYVGHYGRPGADHAWHFLVGVEPDIRRLADAVGFGYLYDAERDEYVHSSGLMILTPDGKVSRYLFGISYSPVDLGFGLEDASAGRIGSPITRPLRLLCYTYDPSQGRYTIAVMRVVQAGGVATVLLLAGAVSRAWWRERRRRGSAG